MVNKVLRKAFEGMRIILGGSVGSSNDYASSLIEAEGSLCDHALVKSHQ